ncbi:MAG: glycosyltransferase [Acidimicrobiales bacterium]
MLVDTALVAVGAIYFIASLLLFVMGANLCALALTVWRRRRPGSAGDRRAVSAMDRSEMPRVTVQLPIYNELYVAERVIRAACSLDYPLDRLQIQVLDDSTDETSDVVARVVAEAALEGLDIVHHRRAARNGYKAGALAEGSATATGELIAIFDADFIPPSDFLLQTVPDFGDPSVAFVQGRWGHVNRDHSLITRLQSLAIDAHFTVEQTARRLLGLWFNFNGTAGIWRASAIADAGGWTADTLTEDLDLSYRAHLRGWRGHYRDDVEVPGELPPQMSSFRRQQHRWARGSLECAIKLLPATWRSGAPLKMKLQATAHLAAYAIHLLLFTVALLYPPMILAGVRFDRLDTLYGFGYLFGLTSIAPALFFITGQRQVRGAWARELPRIVAVSVLGSGLMLNTVRAATQIVTRRNPEFERTAKFGLEGEGWLDKRYLLRLDRIVYVEAVFGLYSAMSATLAWQHGNWPIFVWACIFAIGLWAVAALTAGQALVINARQGERRPSVRRTEVGA